METVGQIIRLRREAMGLTLADVARRVGLTRSYLSMIENDRVDNPPAARHVTSLERALRIADGELTRAADWSRTPPPVRDELTRLADRQRRARAFAEWLRGAARKRSGGGRSLDQLHRSGQLGKRLNEMVGAAAGRPGTTCARGLDDVDARVPVRFEVPLINRVSAGYPTDFTDLDYPARIADEYVACPQPAHPQAFAARVVGESMTPKYEEGDIVVFSPDAEVEDGSDCFVRLEPDHETTFKRVFFEGDDGTPMIRLQPLNPSFAPMLVERQRVAGLYRAVWRFQKLG